MSIAREAACCEVCSEVDAAEARDGTRAVTSVFSEKNVEFQMVYARMSCNRNCINGAEIEIFVQNVCTELRTLQFVRKICISSKYVNAWAKKCG